MQTGIPVKLLRTLAGLAVLVFPAVAGASPADPKDTIATVLPPNVFTYTTDGRLPIQDLLGAYQPLLDVGWHLDVIILSQPTGTAQALPIVALRSPATGPAAWFITGVHGEEPAGPNAMAAAVPALAALAQRMSVVLIPLANPQGYVRNWRYLNMQKWSPDAEAQSVGDSSHLLEDPGHPGQARAAAASSPEADAITRYILQWSTDYPPRYSIDLHEDNLLEAGYVYSQGTLGAADPLAAAAVKTLADNGIAIKMDGETRFEEPIEGGIVGPVTDSSVDELMSAARIVVDGAVRPGPAARTVLVFETPARDLPLEKRRAAHLALLRRLAELLN